jgi:hypothetical protein
MGVTKKNGRSGAVGGWVLPERWLGSNLAEWLR